MTKQIVERQRWTDERSRQLADLWNQKLSPVEISAILKVTPNSVSIKASRMGLPPRMRGEQAGLPSQESHPKGAGLRRCLRCTRMFASSSNGNRICSTCKNSDDWLNGGDGYYVISAPSMTGSGSPG